MGLTSSGQRVLCPFPCTFLVGVRAAARFGHSRHARALASGSVHVPVICRK